MSYCAKRATLFSHLLLDEYQSCSVSASLNSQQCRFHRKQFKEQEDCCHQCSSPSPCPTLKQSFSNEHLFNKWSFSIPLFKALYSEAFQFFILFQFRNRILFSFFFFLFEKNSESKRQRAKIRNSVITGSSSNACEGGEAGTENQPNLPRERWESSYSKHHCFSHDLQYQEDGVGAGAPQSGPVF